MALLDCGSMILKRMITAAVLLLVAAGSYAAVRNLPIVTGCDFGMRCAGKPPHG